MKQGLHPTYNQATVSCACGNKFTVGSVEQSINVEICANCHPFYTGKAKFIDTAGRMDKFAARLEKREALNTAVAPSKQEKAEQRAAKKAEKTA